MNKLMNKKVLPLKALFPKRFLNSLCRVIITRCHRKEIREGVNQNVRGKIKIPKMVLIQLRERLKIEDEGSNTENKFIIIFKI